MMKPGDLVMIGVGFDLDYFLEPITQEIPYPQMCYEKIQEDHPLIVLQITNIPRLNRLGQPDSMVQVLTPSGITGWLFMDQLEIQS